MIATAFLSMWISNTATVILMLPIAVSVLEMFRERASMVSPHDDGEPQRDEFGNFATALMLGVAYAASIGGIGTLIGTPPNLVLASFLEQHYGIEVTMIGWMRIGLPLVVLLLPLSWLLLTRFVYPVRIASFPEGRELIGTEIDKLGPMGRAEKLVLIVFMLAAAGWILRPQIIAWTGLHGLSDTVIGIGCALLLFLIPVDARRGVFLMDWQTAKQLPWGILILFGGGLSLAAAVVANGVDAWIASAFAELRGVPPLLAVAAVSLVVVFLTEITSNTAVTTTLLPVLAATAIAADLPPGLLLTAAALSASCAFMLPVATPPNAVVFSSGYVRVAQMATAGIWLNLIAIALITLLVHYCGCRLSLAGQ
jgi:sodium-dependent dicarboxylate transporter 2/3/5